MDLSLKINIISNSLHNKLVYNSTLYMKTSILMKRFQEL